MTNTETMTMTHLTLTGVEAGRPICDVNKAEAKERGENFVHATYAPNALFETGSDLCPKCREEWDAAGSDEE